MPTLPGEIQIAGRTCSKCGLKVVFAEDGKWCAHCDVVVHAACDPNDPCVRCGGRYQEFERPPRDLVEDAIVPRGLRSVRPDSSVALVFVGLVLFLFSFLFWILLTNG